MLVTADGQARLRYFPVAQYTTMTAPIADLTHHDDACEATSHAERRLALEQELHVQATRRRFQLESWYEMPGLIRHSLRLAGLYGRGQHNARQIELREHRLCFDELPSAFKGFRILHLSDLHLDMDATASSALVERVKELDYDLCVLTGDYRASTYGSCEPAMAALTELRSELKGEVYAVLGNHDSIEMVASMETLGIEVLLNSGLRLRRNGQSVGLAGIDDAHYFKLHDINAAHSDVADEPVKILLSHTPEVFGEAASAGFDAFFCGHTHGGQICLPGGIPLTLEARCPRSLGRGPWQFEGMQGYTSAGAGTSIVNVRFNCPPEVTIHTLDKAD